jgi:hypothetical protein
VEPLVKDEVAALSDEETMELAGRLIMMDE